MRARGSSATSPWETRAFLAGDGGGECLDTLTEMAAREGGGVDGDEALAGIGRTALGAGERARILAQHRTAQAGGEQLHRETDAEALVAAARGHGARECRIRIVGGITVGIERPGGIDGLAEAGA